MRSKVAQSIRNARRAAGLTQTQLGQRLGLKTSAVYRWEADTSVPTKHHRRALVTAFNAIDPAAAAALQATLASEVEGADAGAASVAELPPAGINGRASLELAVFAMADELDLPPRRVRGSLVRLLERLREANFTLETAQGQLGAWSASSE